jgi:hypothetical protein
MAVHELDRVWSFVNAHNVHTATARCRCGYVTSQAGDPDGDDEKWALVNLRIHITRKTRQEEHPCHGLTKEQVVVRRIENSDHRFEIAVVPPRRCKNIALKGSKFCRAHQGQIWA